MRRIRSDFGMASTAITALALACGPAIAAPLDAETCARLKAQRDELHAAGVREAMSQPPPARGTQFPTERAQQIKAFSNFYPMNARPIQSLNRRFLLKRQG